ncbi:MAG: type III-B CRISPR module-associated Cmr3 family protein [Bacteroidia bacterium]
MNTKTYLITFTPHQLYFFGSEQNFGMGDDKNYFARSNYFPQQTTLLGALRYLLLAQNGFLVTGSSHGKLPAQNANGINVVDLIGQQSFHGIAQDFGQILQLSPLFLCHQAQGVYLQAPINHAHPLSRKRKNGISYLAGQTTEANWQLENEYDPKNGFSPLYLNNVGDTACNSIFKEHFQVGIEKVVNAKSKKEKEEAFYKQVFYRLRADFSFGMYVEMKQDFAYQFQDTHLHLGAEKCLFQVRIAEQRGKNFTQMSNELKDVLPNSKKCVDNHKRIVLLSPTFVDTNIYSYCDYAITETQDFRFLKTNVQQTQEYSNLSTKGNVTKTLKSGKYQLLKAGSVLYPKAGHASLLEVALNNAVWQKIGYNFFHYF